MKSNQYNFDNCDDDFEIPIDLLNHPTTETIRARNKFLEELKKVIIIEQNNGDFSCKIEQIEFDKNLDKYNF